MGGLFWHAFYISVLHFLRAGIELRLNIRFGFQSGSYCLVGFCFFFILSRKHSRSFVAKIICLLSLLACLVLRAGAIIMCLRLFESRTRALMTSVQLRSKKRGAMIKNRICSVWLLIILMCSFEK